MKARKDGEDIVLTVDGQEHRLVWVVGFKISPVFAYTEGAPFVVSKEGHWESAPVVLPSADPHQEYIEHMLALGYYPDGHGGWQDTPPWWWNKDEG